MNFDDALPYVSYSVDDALSAGDFTGKLHRTSVLVGWQCGFEPLFVEVHSYLDCELDDDEAEGYATGYLKEIGWFAGEPREANFILRREEVSS